MKWMIASDIHGSAYYCQKMLERFEQEKADKLLLLGDLLYHGPRNDLPKEYNPKAVIQMLNSYADQILCVRGNCDAEVDQMVLDFPIMADYAILNQQTHCIYVTHGHLDFPKKAQGDYYLQGHTHVPTYENHHLNPGSVSLPKQGSCHSYMIWDTDFYWKELETGDIYQELKWEF